MKKFVLETRLCFNAVEVLRDEPVDGANFTFASVSFLSERESEMQSLDAISDTTE